MADVSNTFAAWSSTTASNLPSGATTIGTGLDDNLREIQGVIVRALSYKGADIASATTTDLGAVEGLSHDITGTTTITGFGTTRAGTLKVVKFEGALTLTHNATSLILLTGANRTTADGDIGFYISEGSGNWREVTYLPAGTALIAGGLKFPATQVPSSDANTLDDYEEGSFAPTITFATPGNLNVVYASQSGFYTKIGRHVFFNINIQTSTFTHTTASGSLNILWSGFTAGTNNCPGEVIYQGITNAAYTDIKAQVAAGTSITINLVASASGAAIATVAAADMPTGGTVVLRISGSFNL